MCTAALAGTQVSVELGGKKMTLDPVTVAGKTYVSLDQLKVAGLPFSKQPGFRIDLDPLG